jgi:hypothetical protein
LTRQEPTQPTWSAASRVPLEHASEGLLVLGPAFTDEAGGRQPASGRAGSQQGMMAEGFAAGSQQPAAPRKDVEWRYRPTRPGYLRMGAKEVARRAEAAFPAALADRCRARPWLCRGDLLQTSMASAG